MLDLPEEVWYRIISYLDPKSQMQLALTSTQALPLVLDANENETRMSMERARQQIHALLRDEESLKERYEKSKKLDDLFEYNGSRAWRRSSSYSFPYLEFREPFVVFRADTRSPGEVFMTGFRRLSEDKPQLGMSFDVGGIAHHLVSTSKSATDSLEFAIIRGEKPLTMVEVRANIDPKRPPKAKVWIYVCLATEGFYLHAPVQIEGKPVEVKRNRHEVAVIGIPSSAILAAVEIDVKMKAPTGVFKLNCHLELSEERTDMLARMLSEIVRKLTPPPALDQ